MKVGRWKIKYLNHTQIKKKVLKVDVKKFKLETNNSKIGSKKLPVGS